MENWEKNWLGRRETKMAVSEARSRAFEGFYQVLETKNEEQQICKIVKRREKRIRDLDQVKCIKDKEGNILVADGDIKERWRKYFYLLFNEEQTTSINAEDLTI